MLKHLEDSENGITELYKIFHASVNICWLFKSRVVKKRGGKSVAAKAGFEEMWASAAAARLIERKRLSSRQRVGGRERKELMQRVGITSTSPGFTLRR